MTTPLKVTPGEARGLERNLRGKKPKKVNMPFDIHGYYKGIQFHVDIKMDINELTGNLSPEQIAALLDGIGKCIAAERGKIGAKPT